MDKLEKLKYDTIILGGTLEALVHSYIDGIPIIMVNPQIPFERDNHLNGLNKNSVWRRLSFYLSYAGFNPIGDKAGNYRLDEDGVITLFGKNPYKIQIKYNNIIRYDEIIASEKLRVLDYIKLENIQTSDIETINKINTGDDFINQFYTIVNKKISEVIAVSRLTADQIKQEFYSETYARLKALEVLKKSGIIGRVEILKDGSTRTHKLKTTILKRQIISESRETEDQLLAQKPETKNSILKQVTKIFGTPYVN